jgi:hypothetical protein
MPNNGPTVDESPRLATEVLLGRTPAVLSHSYGSPARARGVRAYRPTVWGQQQRLW